MDVIIFCKTGVTYRFVQVKNLVEKEGVLTFEYIGLSTKQHRKATFTNYAGYSIADPDEQKTC